jgi:hypothetical protein
VCFLFLGGNLYQEFPPSPMPQVYSISFSKATPEGSLSATRATTISMSSVVRVCPPYVEFCPWRDPSPGGRSYYLSAPLVPAAGSYPRAMQARQSGGCHFLSLPLMMLCMLTIAVLSYYSKYHGPLSKMILKHILLSHFLLGRLAVFHHIRRP